MVPGVRHLVVAPVCLTASLMFAGCKSNDKAPTPKPGPAAQTPTNPATDKPVTNGSASKPARPPGPPLDKAGRDAIAKLDFAGAKVDVMNDAGEVLMLAIEPTEPPRRVAQLRVGACLQCEPMDLANWTRDKAELMGYLPKELRGSPDTIFDVNQAIIDGETAIATYQAGVFADDTTFAVSHAYTLFWNNGVNQIVITAKDGGLPARISVAELQTRVPREQLEALAIDTFKRIRPSL